MNKKKLIVPSLLVTVLAIYALVQKPIPELRFPQAGQEVPAIHYDLRAATSGLAASAKVYRFTSVTVTADTVKLLGAKLTMKGEPKESRDRFVLTDGNKYLEIEKDSGKTIYMDQAKLFNQTTPPKVVPDDNQSVVIAQTFTQSLGLLEPGFVLSGVTSDTVNQGPLSQPAVIGKTVHFYRTVDGVQVNGVSRVMVNIGNNGEVEGFKKLYKKIELAGEKPLRPIADAFNDVKTGKGTTDISPEAVSAEVTSTNVAYWEDPGTISEQPYLQPVYVFSGQALVAGKSVPFVSVVKALK